MLIFFVFGAGWARQKIISGRSGYGCTVPPCMGVECLDNLTLSHVGRGVERLDDLTLFLVGRVALRLDDLTTHVDRGVVRLDDLMLSHVGRGVVRLDDLTLPHVGRGLLRLDDLTLSLVGKGVVRLDDLTLSHVGRGVVRFDDLLDGVKDSDRARRAEQQAMVDCDDACSILFTSVSLVVSQFCIRPFLFRIEEEQRTEGNSTMFAAKLDDIFTFR